MHLTRALNQRLLSSHGERPAERVEERDGLRLNGQETLLHFPAHGLAQCCRRVPAALIGGEWAQGWNISGTARLIDRHHGEEAAVDMTNFLGTNMFGQYFNTHLHLLRGRSLRRTRGGS